MRTIPTNSHKLVGLTCPYCHKKNSTAFVEHHDAGNSGGSLLLLPHAMPRANHCWTPAKMTPLRKDHV
jgi:hypothetical protein